MQDKGAKQKLLNAAVLYWMHDLAAQGIITTDSELNLVEWNHWMEEHTGKRASEVMGKNLLELFSGVERETFGPALQVGARGTSAGVVASAA